ncbi:carboxypeptidase regulatory-like domain-containing protein [Sphingomonas kaistensis]|uniref:Carboxypeptidase regulatory-like domain-containing protein n=1 Tax=Sphingomonas kaistensis TaxID=298708 RepID=A0ABZ2FYN1_9SPHN
MLSGWLRLPLTLLAAAGIGMAAPASAPPSGPAWSADPDSQYLLDLQIRQRALGDGVRAYPVPEGTCVILGDLVTALDLPIKIDLSARKAQGWAFKEANRLVIDRAVGKVAFGATGQETIAPGAIRDAPDGWCVETATLSRWLGLTIESRTDASLLLLESKDKLPVELAAERRERAARLTRASLPMTALPRVTLPYRMWRTPSVDVMMDAGVTYSAGSGAKIDHRASILAAGEALQMSYEARVSVSRGGLPNGLRFRAYRSDPDAGLLGPLKATHLAVGDVEGIGSPIAGTTATGRGAMITNRPLFQSVAFDRTQFSGELPPGWDAELYRNGELVAFSGDAPDGQYRFADVALGFGDNRFEILTYGPQGQVKRRVEIVNVGQGAVPPGETHYWAGVVDPGRDLIERHRGGAPPNPEAGWRAAASVEHGLDKRTSVAALVQTLAVDDRRVTYVEGTVRRSIGPAVTEFGAARDSAGGVALRGQALAKIGATNLAWSSFWSRDFAARPSGLSAVSEHRFSVDAPLKLGGDTVMPLHGDLRLASRKDCGRTLEANARTSIMLSRFNLATLLRYREERAPGGLGNRKQVEAGLIGSGRIGPVRLRGATEFEIAPASKLRRAEVSAYWRGSGSTDWEGAVAYEAQDRLVRGRVAHIRRFDAFAVAGTLEAASNGSVAAGLNLSFSLDRGSNGWRASRQSLAATGSVRAQLFRDTNGNGRRDDGEKLEEGAILTAGTRPADQPSGKDGWASVAGLDNFRPVAIGVDTSSLSDPNLVPAIAAQVVVPRPGVSAEVMIPLSGGGAIEGSLVKDGGSAFEGLDLELVDERGNVVAIARSDYDGFFLFERVAPGRYLLRLSEASRTAAKAQSASLKSSVELQPEQAVLRLGPVVVKATAQIAAVNHEVVSGDFAVLKR